MVRTRVSTVRFVCAPALSAALALSAQAQAPAQPITPRAGVEQAFTTALERVCLASLVSAQPVADMPKPERYFASRLVARQFPEAEIAWFAGRGDVHLATHGQGGCTVRVTRAPDPERLRALAVSTLQRLGDLQGGPFGPAFGGEGKRDRYCGSTAGRLIGAVMSTRTEPRSRAAAIQVTVFEDPRACEPFAAAGG